MSVESILKKMIADRKAKTQPAISSKRRSRGKKKAPELFLDLTRQNFRLCADFHRRYNFMKKEAEAGTGSFAKFMGDFEKISRSFGVRTGFLCKQYIKKGLTHALLDKVIAGDFNGNFTTTSYYTGWRRAENL